MKDKYIISDIYQMNAYYKEGYEFLFAYSEMYSNNNTAYVSGNFMGNPLNMDMPVSGIHNNIKVVMQLTKPAEVLYGEKRENNT